MKYIGAVAVLSLLFSSWLCFTGDNRAAKHDQDAIATLNQIVAAESALRENVLNARLGLLREYDPLDHETDRLYALIGRLRNDGVSASDLLSLHALIDAQDGMIETFKTDNALLQNSLSYFGLLSGAGTGLQDGGTLNAAITSLSTAILHLMLDPSDASTAEVKTSLAQLAEEAPPAVDADQKAGLLIHGRTLQVLLPATDALLQNLYVLPITAHLDSIRTTIAARQRERQTSTNIRRLIIYAFSLLLICLLGVLGWQLRKLLQDLKRRANFEHSMVAISMRYANASDDEIRTIIEWSLSEVARRIGADRAYLIVSATSDIYVWTRDGKPWLAGWPEETPLDLDGLAHQADILYHPSVAKMPVNAERRQLSAAGARGWLSMGAAGPDVHAYRLGFESLARPMTWPAAEAASLRMAGEIIGSAVVRKCLEAEQARLESSLQNARRMETVGALTSGVAHNFNNVIAAVLGHTEMLEPIAAPGTRFAQHVLGIRQAAERARDLVEQILHFGRRQDAQQRHVLLKPLLLETEALLMAALPHDAHLIVEEVPDAAVALGEPTQLQQIIINLCNNAYQALEGMGTIAVSVSLPSLENARQMSHGKLPAGQYVCISVRDGGRGMSAATLERLFEPFFTTKAKGHGIGLATVHEIVTGYGGAINVTSRLGVGSSFDVWLPRASPDSSHSLGHTADRIRGNGETIMILHEDAELLLRDEDIIAALGYEPVGYDHVGQAILGCADDPDRFDLVVINQFALKARCIEVAEKIHELMPSVPILLASSAETLEAERLAKAGICEVLKTPLESADLAAALSRWLAEGARLRGRQERALT